MVVKAPAVQRPAGELNFQGLSKNPVLAGLVLLFDSGPWLSVVAGYIWSLVCSNIYIYHDVFFRGLLLGRPNVSVRAGGVADLLGQVGLFG